MICRKFSQVFHEEDCRFGFGINESGEYGFMLKDKKNHQEDIQRFKDSCDFSVMKSYLYQNASTGKVQDYAVGIRETDLSDELNDIKKSVDNMSLIFNSLPVGSRLGAKNPIEYLKKLMDGGYEQILEINKINDKNLSDSKKSDVGGDGQ